MKNSHTIVIQYTRDAYLIISPIASTLLNLKGIHKKGNQYPRKVLYKVAAVEPYPVTCTS